MPRHVSLKGTITCTSNIYVPAVLTLTVVVAALLGLKEAVPGPLILVHEYVGVPDTYPLMTTAIVRGPKHTSFPEPVITSKDGSICIVPPF